MVSGDDACCMHDIEPILALSAQRVRISHFSTGHDVVGHTSTKKSGRVHVRFSLVHGRALPVDPRSSLARARLTVWSGPVSSVWRSCCGSAVGPVRASVKTFRMSRGAGFTHLVRIEVSQALFPPRNLEA